MRKHNKRKKKISRDAFAWLSFGGLLAVFLAGGGLTFMKIVLPIFGIDESCRLSVRGIVLVLGIAVFTTVVLVILCFVTWLLLAKYVFLLSRDDVAKVVYYGSIHPRESKLFNKIFPPPPAEQECDYNKPRKFSDRE